MQLFGEGIHVHAQPFNRRGLKLQLPDFPDLVLGNHPWAKLVQIKQVGAVAAEINIGSAQRGFHLDVLRDVFPEKPRMGVYAG